MGRVERHDFEFHRDDSGTTLIELIVGMMVMGVFMTIFTGAVVSMAKTTTKVEAVTTSASQVNNAFLTMDRTIRYASAIGTPGTGPSGDWYVELESVVYGSASAETQCVQLRLGTASQQLQLRTWTPVAASSYSGLTSWKPLAEKISNGSALPGSADQPFAIPPALTTASTPYQQLTITLVGGTTAAASTTTTRTTVTFTALNSSRSDATNKDKCRQVARS